MQWTNEEKQEWLDYIFQHNYDRIEQAAKRLGQKGGQFSMNISFKKEEGLRTNHTVPDYNGRRCCFRGNVKISYTM
jgi:hypothetical protein